MMGKKIMLQHRLYMARSLYNKPHFKCANKVNPERTKTTFILRLCVKFQEHYKK